MKGRRFFIIISVSCTLFLSAYLSQAAEEEKAEASGKQETEEIVTNLGVVRVGTTEEQLYDIFQKKDRLYVPHKIMNKEWLIFRDITSTNPHQVITFYLKDGVVTGWKRGFSPTPDNPGSKYEYNQDEKIEHWFFPPDKARWNGLEVTAMEWNLFKESQKVMFLTEYIAKLGEEKGKKIDIDVNKYILALNHYADTCPDLCLEMKLFELINKLLKSEGKIEDKAEEVKIEETVQPTNPGPS